MLHPQTEFNGMVPYEGGEIDLGSPFRRASMADLVLEATGVDFGSFAADVEGAKAAALEAMKKADVATRPTLASLSRVYLCTLKPAPPVDTLLSGPCAP